VNHINKAYFEARMADRKLSQNQLADKLGIDRSAMSRMMAGKRKMSAAEAGEIAKHLGISVEDALRNAGVPVSPDSDKTAPIVGTVGDRLEVKLGPVRGSQSLVVPADLANRKGRILTVQQQGFMFGWRLLYVPVDAVSSDALMRLCVVRKRGDDRLYVRQVNRGPETGWLSLFTPTTGELEDAMLDMAAPIWWIKQF
jgi:transcriptional regulator with XRE-family HTH domain